MCVNFLSFSQIIPSSALDEIASNNGDLVDGQITYSNHYSTPKSEILTSPPYITHEQISIYISSKILCQFLVFCRIM